MSDFEFNFGDLEHSCKDLANFHFPNAGARLKAFKAAEQSGGPVADELEKLRLAVAVNGEPTKAEWAAMHRAYVEKLQSQRTPDNTPVHKVSDALWGSKWQWMCGKVVADELFAPNVHPAFGILLHPTGGGVGPDASNFNVEKVIGSPLGKLLGDEIDADLLAAAVRHHAAVHDAAGFLKHSFDHGPGYTYAHGQLQWLPWISTSIKDFWHGTFGSALAPSRDKLRGQVTGIVFWYRLFQNDPQVRRV